MEEKDAEALSLYSERDILFLQGAWPKPFAFNEEVVRVFDDMISRSIPLYREVMLCAVQWAKAYDQPHARILDLGCSTGTLLELIGRFFSHRASLIGIDNSQAMLDQAQKKLEKTAEQHEILLHRQDAIEADFTGCDVIFMNYTLQFLPIPQRLAILSAAHQGLKEGGLLFLSEKVHSAVPVIQEVITRQYEAFKERNGYARMEIARKKEALEQILIPLTLDQQREMLCDAGFLKHEILLKMHGFTTFVAIKSS